MPDKVRTAPVPEIVIPAGEATCDGEPCLSKREAAKLLEDFAAGFATCNSKLYWLDDWADVIRAANAKQ